ncbi:MAG TPA: MYG1 family protein, partial [Myxococcota bacterium]|nr:MYG1 family protein [Myxococcota bacterium]
AFLDAADIGGRLIAGLERGWREVRAARELVLRAMDDAVAARRSVIYLDEYVPWKPVYFEHGGESHPTDYVLYPSDGDTWKLLAIPPSLGQFEQKRPLPAAWAGRLGAELEAVTGIPGSVFCHKNRFVAVFRTREAALAAIERFGLGEVRGA